MKRPGYWVCLGAVAVLGLAACGGEDGGEDVVADTYVPDILADNAPNDPGTPDPGLPDTPADPGEAPDTVEAEDPGAQPDTPTTDAPTSDAAEEVMQPASRACIGCHTNKAILEELAPEDEEPAGGGG